MGFCGGCGAAGAGETRVPTEPLTAEPPDGNDQRSAWEGPAKPRHRDTHLPGVRARLPVALSQRRSGPCEATGF